jgi:membrane protein required for colicin V production
MNSLDLFLLIPIGLGFIFGIFKGLVKELTSLVAIILGIFGAKLLAPYFSGILKTSLPLTYLLLFIAIGVGLLLLANMLDKIFDSISLGGLNKLLGGIFGGLKYALIVSVLLNVFNSLDNRLHILGTETKENSIAYKPVMKLGPTLWNEAKKAHIDKPKREPTDEGSRVKNK